MLSHDQISDISYWLTRIVKVLDYDSEFFSRGDNEDEDKANMKSAIKKLFDMFKQEEKKAKNRSRSSSKKPAAEKVKCDFED